MSLERGKSLLLHFFAGASLSSVKDMSKLKKLLPKLSKYKIKLITIFLDYDMETIARAIDGEGINWTICYDLSSTRSPVAKLYAVEQLPMYYLIDANGIIRDKAFTADSINVSSINTIQ